jgi:hypothetical protein
MKRVRLRTPKAVILSGNEEGLRVNAIPAPKPVKLSSFEPRGMNFVRRSIALAAAHGDVDQAQNIARHRWGEKTAVPAIAADDISGGGLDTAAIEFFSAVMERSAFGRTVGFRRRPIGTRYLINAGDMTGSWVAEGRAIPLLPLSFEQSRMELLKVASICVFTDETIQSLDPRVEASIRRDMIDGLAAAIDTAYLDPDNGGTAGQTPASITNGLTPVAVGTGTLDDFRDALSTMIAGFAGDLSRAVFYGRPELFAMLNGLGYDTVGLRGGELVGAPAIATSALPNAATDFYQLVLADPGAIAVVDEPSQTSVVASREAAIEMADNPTGDATTPTGANLISLYQCNSTALKALAFCNFEVEQEGAVAMMLALPVADIS